MRRALTGLGMGVVLAVLLGASGQAAAVPATVVHYTEHHCHASPPDVVDLADVPFGGDGGQAPPTGQERDIENHYLYAHWGVGATAIWGNGRTYMGFTDDAQRHLAELRALLPAPSRVRAYCAPYSEAELGTARDRLMADTAMIARGLHWSGIGSDGLDGRIDVMFTHLNPGDEDWLRQRYGDILGKVSEGWVIPD